MNQLEKIFQVALLILLVLGFVGMVFGPVVDGVMGVYNVMLRIL
jgi:hypothetical protein